MYGKIRIILAYSKKAKVFETRFTKRNLEKLLVIKNILKNAFSHRFQCERQHLINLLIFNILLISEGNLYYSINPLQSH